MNNYLPENAEFSLDFDIQFQVYGQGGFYIKHADASNNPFDTLGSKRKYVMDRILP